MYKYDSDYQFDPDWEVKNMADLIFAEAMKAGRLGFLFEGIYGPDSVYGSDEASKAAEEHLKDFIPKAYKRCQLIAKLVVDTKRAKHE
jgi:hypothetical protein